MTQYVDENMLGFSNAFTFILQLEQCLRTGSRKVLISASRPISQRLSQRHSAACLRQALLYLRCVSRWSPRYSRKEWKIHQSTCGERSNSHQLQFIFGFIANAWKWHFIESHSTHGALSSLITFPGPFLSTIILCMMDKFDIPMILQRTLIDESSGCCVIFRISKFT